MGDSPKWVKSKKRREKKREREKEREKESLNDGDNNGQATHGARKHAWRRRTQAAWAKSSNLVLLLYKDYYSHQPPNHIFYIYLASNLIK